LRLAKFLVFREALPVLPTLVNQCGTSQSTIDCTVASAEWCSISKKFASGLQAHRSADNCLAT